MADPKDVLNNATTSDGGEGDGVALYSTQHPLNITDEMIEAGMSVMRGAEKTTDRQMLAEVYTAMVHAAPPIPDDISEDAIETVEIELPDSMFEGLARLIAHMHGSAFTYKPPGDELMQTVASQAGYGHWGHSPERYADANWQKYVGAAKAAVQFLRQERE